MKIIINNDLWKSEDELCQHCRQKCPFSRDKKRDLERPKLRTEFKNLAKHPPKWWTRHLFHAFSIFGRALDEF